jgi:Zn-dependent M16 (insulinase) family peptidase
MDLQKGQKLDSGFTVIDIVDLAEMKAVGIWARHDKTNAEVFHVLNDDSENLFAFAFATTPQDDTGVSHILEHSVLCGSERYPIKDAFLVLAQGSLQTFLNAWTFPDKTVYPASSVNERDYFNLMSVYGDAVFRPLLAEWTFMQEGHRYEYGKDGEGLSVTGVVYNEMKGAYSSPDSYAQLWSVKAVLPDTPYSFESGGAPEFIPDLTWEGLKDFHRRRYSPANCRVFLAGNIPTEKQLAFLNDNFFSSLEGGAACARIVKQKRWDAPKEFTVPCPAGADDESSDDGAAGGGAVGGKSTVFLSWLLCDATDTDENIALVALTEILMGHDGSPLTKALIQSGLGEDISPVSGIESELGETLFIAGLRGVGGSGAANNCGAGSGGADCGGADCSDAGCSGGADCGGADCCDADCCEDAAKKIEALIMGELRRLADEGIPKGEIEAALLFMEFSQREVKRSGGPFSLVWMRRSLRAWLHGSRPWESLLLVPSLEKLKQRLAENDRYFESLIQKYLLDNPHRALVTVEPQKDFLANQEKRLAEKIARTEQGMSDADRRLIIDKAASLEKLQSESDSPASLAAIPHLSRKDLSPEPEIIPRRLEDMEGLPALCHDIYTNGISYIDLAFPLDILKHEDYQWIPFFTRAVISVGLPGMDYAEVSSLLARTVGGLRVITHTGSAAGGAGGGGSAGGGSPLIKTPAGKFDLIGRDWIIYRLKCLDEKTAASLDLTLRLISEADFSDLRRIHDLVMEMKNEARSSLAPAGHHYASVRANRYASVSTQTEEIWNGLTQLFFIHRLAETDTAEIAAKLKNLREAIASGGLIANLAGSDDALKSGGKLLAQRFKGFGPPRKRKQEKMTSGGISGPEVFASPSLQVGFAAMTLQAAEYDTLAQASETVLAHQLSTGALWENIRMKGGAYGATASSNGLERCFSMSTYRDPNPLRSLDTFYAILKDSAYKVSDLEKMIIGCYSSETRPRSPSEKTANDLLRFLSRIDDGCRRRKLERLINIREDDISAVMEGIASQLASQKPPSRVIIAGTNSAEQAAKALGADVQMLPV